MLHIFQASVASMVACECFRVRHTLLPTRRALLTSLSPTTDPSLRCTVHAPLVTMPGVARVSPLWVVTPCMITCAYITLAKLRLLRGSTYHGLVLLHSGRPVR